MSTNLTVVTRNVNQAYQASGLLCQGKPTVFVMFGISWLYSTKAAEDYTIIFDVKIMNT